MESVSFTTIPLGSSAWPTSSGFITVSAVSEPVYNLELNSGSAPNTVLNLTIAVGVLAGLWVLTIGILLFLFFRKRKASRASQQAVTAYNVDRDYSDVGSVRDDDRTMIDHATTPHFIVVVDGKKAC